MYHESNQGHSDVLHYSAFLGVTLILVFAHLCGHANIDRGRSPITDEVIFRMSRCTVMGKLFLYRIPPYRCKEVSPRQNTSRHALYFNFLWTPTRLVIQHSSPRFHGLYLRDYLSETWISRFGSIALPMEFKFVLFPRPHFDLGKAMIGFDGNTRGVKISLVIRLHK